MRTKRVVMLGNVGMTIAVLWAAYHTYPTSPIAAVAFVLMGCLFLSRSVRRSV